MTELTRREALKTISFGSFATGIMMTGCGVYAPDKDHPFSDDVSPEDIEKWHQEFFTDHEYETVRQLTNLIIPADERSGNAEDAGVPPFIDFMMLDKPRYQEPMRNGLERLDEHCNEQFDADFIHCDEDEQKEMLDQIAYPEEADPEMQESVEFFNMMRDFTAWGFFTSEIGIEDLQYMGNKATNWTGCSQPALDHLGVEYDS